MPEYCWHLRFGHMCDCSLWGDQLEWLFSSSDSMNSGFILTKPVVGCCVNEEPNLEERFLPFWDQMRPDTHILTQKRVVWCLVFCVWKASWQRGSCKIGFDHVWSAWLSLSCTLSFFSDRGFKHTYIHLHITYTWEDKMTVNICGFKSLKPGWNFRPSPQLFLKPFYWFNDLSWRISSFQGFLVCCFIATLLRFHNMLQFHVVKINLVWKSLGWLIEKNFLSNLNTRSRFQFWL